MAYFENIKATVIYSGYNKLHFQLEDGTTLVWDSKVAPFMDEGEEVTLTARHRGPHWDGHTTGTAISHVRIKD